MQYFGGKQRIAKELVSFLQLHQGGTDYYLEPFVGGACILENMTGKRFANDINKYLIAMYQALQDDWYPPQFVSENTYQHVKTHQDEDMALTGFIGIGCSYSGKWFGGYSRNAVGRNYALNAYNGLMKQKSRLKDVIFSSHPYQILFPAPNGLIYCDPPYAQTTSYDIIGKFNHVEFWKIMRMWSKTNIVFISEYSAPNDFECVLEIKTRTDIRNKKNELEPRIEKLFQYRSN